MCKIALGIMDLCVHVNKRWHNIPADVVQFVFFLITIITKCLNHVSVWLQFILVFISSRSQFGSHIVSNRSHFLTDGNQIEMGLRRNFATTLRGTSNTRARLCDSREEIKSHPWTFPDVLLSCERCSQVCRQHLQPSETQASHRRHFLSLFIYVQFCDYLPSWLSSNELQHFCRSLGLFL